MPNGESPAALLTRVALVPAVATGRAWSGERGDKVVTSTESVGAVSCAVKPYRYMTPVRS